MIFVLHPTSYILHVLSRLLRKARRKCETKGLAAFSENLFGTHVGVLMLLVAAFCGGCLALAAPVNHVYILTGQSNSLGAVKGSPASAEQLERYKSEGMLWNGNMERSSGKCFESSPKWEIVAPQLPEYNGGLCMGPEYGFCSMMERRGWHTGEKGRICVIKASLDGSGNSSWLPDAPGYESVVGTAQNALSALKGKVQVHELLYLQGESDSGNEITEAPKRFLSLLSRLAGDIRRSSLRQAVVGECATWHGKEKQQNGKSTAQLMGEMARKSKNVGWVRTRDLPKITRGDNMGVHYNGAAQLAIGARYAYAVALLEKLPLPGYVRSDDPAAALNHPGAWWAPSSSVRGNQAKDKKWLIWDISAYNGEDRLEGGLSCDGITVEDPISGCVVVKADEKMSGSLSIGSGGITLKEADLCLQCPVSLTGDQVWELAEGRTLTLGAPGAPVRLGGECSVTIRAQQGAHVKLYVSDECKIRFDGGENVLETTTAVP